MLLDSRHERTCRLAQDRHQIQKATLYGDISDVDGGSVVMTAKSLAGHLDGPKLNRGIFLPLLPEILDDPYEIWVSAEREVLSGKVAIRKRVIKVIDTGAQSKSAKGGRRFMVVLNVNKGFFTGWTFFPVKREKTLNNERRGLLTWSRPEGTQ